MGRVWIWKLIPLQTHRFKSPGLARLKIYYEVLSEFSRVFCVQSPCDAGAASETGSNSGT